MAPVTESLDWPPLSEDAGVYRAYPFQDSFDSKSGKPLPKLFYLRDGETGLSVSLTTGGLLLACPRAFGMCRLKVGTAAVPGVGITGSPDELLVIQDQVDHAEIRGVPMRRDDQEKALRIAKYLVRICENVGI